MIKNDLDKYVVKILFCENLINLAYFGSFLFIQCLFINSFSFFFRNSFLSLCIISLNCFISFLLLSLSSLFFPNFDSLLIFINLSPIFFTLFNFSLFCLFFNSFNSFNFFNSFFLVPSKYFFNASISFSE